MFIEGINFVHRCSTSAGFRVSGGHAHGVVLILGRTGVIYQSNGDLGLWPFPDCVFVCVCVYVCVVGREVGGDGGLWAVSKVENSVYPAGTLQWHSLWLPFGTAFAVLKGLIYIKKTILLQCGSFFLRCWYIAVFKNQQTRKICGRL